MTQRAAVRWLPPLVVSVATLMALAAAAGLLAPRSGGPRAVESVRGEAVTLVGEGLYQYDTVFKGAGNLGTDLVTLAVALPLLLVALWRYRRGAPSGPLLLSAALAWPLYVYATLAVGTAFNPLFLLYVALLSTSLFAMALAVGASDLAFVRGALQSLPNRGIGLFLVACGCVTVVVWGVPLLGALIAREPPKLLDTNTTMVTEALDLSVITPLVLLAGILLLRGHLAEGHRIAVPLLGLLAVLGPAIAAQTAFQVAAGVGFTPGEIVGPLAGFLALSLAAIAIEWSVVRTVDRAARLEPA